MSVLIALMSSRRSWLASLVGWVAGLMSFFWRNGGSIELVSPVAVVMRFKMNRIGRSEKADVL